MINFERPQKVSSENNSEIKKTPMIILKKYMGYIIVSIITFFLSWNMSISINVPTDMNVPLLKKDNSKLKVANRKLKQENKRLIAKQRSMKKMVKKHRENRVKKIINRSKRKIATAPTKMVPLLGTVAIIAMTTYDITNYCEDVDDMKNLETTLFGDIQSDKYLLEIEKICKMDIEKELKPILGEKYDTIKDSFDGSMKWIEENSETSSKWLEENSKVGLDKLKSLFD